MARLWNRKDLRTTWDYDLALTPDTDGQYELLQTDRHPGECLMQCYANVLKTSPGEFSLDSSGASPWKFVGNALTPSLIQAIEDYVLLQLRRGGFTDDGFLVSIKAAPLSKTEIAVRIELRSPDNPSNVINKLDSLISTGDNKIRPLVAGSSFKF